MTDFNKTNWANAEFARQYINNADIYIVERQLMFDLLVSYYRHFIGSCPDKNILDLGCGDGVLARRILSVDRSTAATLVDGSEEMLSNARARLNGFPSVRTIQASFQDMLDRDVLDGEYDFVVSSMAIHHLTLEGKKKLFNLIYAHLGANGHFLNIDVVLPPSSTIEEWYLRIWQEWMDMEKSRLGVSGDQFDTVIKRYKDNDDNKPDTLGDQLNALTETGYKDVDCYYKYGIFTMYGGRKQGGS